MVLEADIYDWEDSVVQRVDYSYDVYNRLVRRQLDTDGPDHPHAATDQFFSYVGNQVQLQFDGNRAIDLSHRYLWGPAVDQLLADEQIAPLAPGVNQRLLPAW